ncbi:dynamin family protein [Colletotrichum truncatum]|uniref:Dynamin family protein n=1 Tax=Colletotrichum truncatum TaxID=5467 RepID=A0ACC3YMT1_COLTU|nr:dynamin family protein [Colletotrichum truncatum]KAF6792141.1 dynamin family protein [Colletotrichum truncatum]
MAPVQSTPQTPGLGNRHLLDKIDRLRELGISKQVPLPQLVVVGDQSSGKSSVLESLTGYYFPRSVGLCTRHATEIVCRREQETSIVVTVHPVDATPEREERAKSFKQVLKDLKGEEFANVLKKASEVMGLQSAANTSSGAAFSKDILRVEICGPEEEHLTIIDVPGIFENPQEGVTTAQDVALVKAMVKEYIKDSRTIILAVIPCNVDVATQTILTYAAEADPDGKRTLGVLTKPDLVSENATKMAVMDLVRGKRRDIQLGYYVVKNRSADDTSSNKEERDLQEEEFFGKDPWSKLDKSRLGISALRKRLRELLMDRTKSEFPKVKRDIIAKIHEAKGRLQALGEPRSNADEQRAFLGKIVSRYCELKKFGLDAYYTADPVFEHNPKLKLVTRIREMNTAFSLMFFEKGHLRSFEALNAGNRGTQGGSSESDKSDEVDEDEAVDDSAWDELYPLSFIMPLDQLDDVEEVLSEPADCSEPEVGTIMEHLEKLFVTSRGYDLGTFGSHMLPMAFKEQSSKWESIALAHVSSAILVVHHFIHGVVREACGDEQVRDLLWSSMLEDLTKRYEAAMKHARFLIHVERDGRSITYNPAFDRAFSLVKSSRFADQHKSSKVRIRYNETLVDVVRWDDLNRPKTDAQGLKETCCAIHDLLKSYYDISSARFIDMVCTQVVDHFLVGGEDSPLGVLSPNRLFGMSEEELEMIAGEDSISKSTREMLIANILMLEAGKKIL